MCLTTTTVVSGEEELGRKSMEQENAFEIYVCKTGDALLVAPWSFISLFLVPGGHF